MQVEGLGIGVWSSGLRFGVFGLEERVEYLVLNFMVECLVASIQCFMLSA